MSHEILLENDKFAGYRWVFLESNNWDTLIQIATIRKDGLACKLLPEIGLGYNHMVRILEFSDQLRWGAKLRMPHLPQDGDGPDAGGQIMESEYYTLQLVHELSQDSVGMDLSMAAPSKDKLRVFSAMAEIQIKMFNIRLPKIGKITGINDDGSYRQGPIPGLGGPFNTAAEFFRAWSTKVDFGLSHNQLKDAAGSFVDELSISSLAFNALMNDMVEELSKSDEGPFPLCHSDFGHNNMIFDDNYRLLGVIDWEGAFAAPWRQLQQERGITEGYGLSPVLQDSQWQHIASAMRLYQSGNPGWYAKVLQEISKDG
ncbi:hypothetical protein BDV34DRAFT_219095 [Aspergillus parasiticus]|uniref:Aminoglycoside phosphotransferase domain-containing protein n=1 Tax=Aspergillus parasiticus TaxID=5067 RepID=A0A5N6E3J3_ASPPA|nr:hypothetical protein BDV34DRAFT_219095 [Aspergillus parasiticus]